MPDTITEDSFTLTVTIDGYDITIENDRSITEISKSDIQISLEVTSEEVNLTADGTIIKEVKDGNVPIPVVFYYVGGTKDTGVVISSEEGDDLNNTKKENQFAWAPVESNQDIQIDVTSKEDIASIEINGEAQTVSGKTFSKAIENPRVNKRYNVTVTDSEGNVRKLTKALTSLYGQNYIFQINFVVNQVGYKYKTVEEAIKGEGASSLNDLLATAGSSSLFKYTINTGILIKEEIRQIDGSLEQTFQEIKDNSESVNKYEGFYIARLEEE